jgi:hypothetical protein
MRKRYASLNARDMQPTTMNKLLIIFISYFSFLTAYSQIDKKEINMRFLNFYPIDLPEVFIDKPLKGQIKMIEISEYDTIKYQTNFENNKLNSVVFDSSKVAFSYRFGKLSRINYINHDTLTSKTKIYKILPFIFAFDNGLSATGFRLFGKTYKMKQLSGFKTYSKTKAKYRNGRVYVIKNYNWQPVAQRCYFTDYHIFDYSNDTIVMEKIYDRNDSLAFETKFVFDKYGNVLETRSLSRKRATGWGIDVTHYSYDANQTDRCIFNYKFDDQNNWIEKSGFVNDTLQKFKTRIITYEN